MAPDDPCLPRRYRAGGAVGSGCLAGVQVVRAQHQPAAAGSWWAMACDTARENMFMNAVKRVLGGRAERTTQPDLIQDNEPVAAETPHQKVFRLVGERRFEESARLAKRLIDAGDVDGFFLYTGTAGHARAQKLFDDNVSVSRKGMFTDIQGLTPQFAQVILENNVENRKINATGLAARMRDIADGRWELTGQGLIVAKSGELNDGQHRVWAVLLTTTSIRIPIFYGVPRSSISCLDIGKVRTGADRFHFAGIKNYAVISAMVGLTYRLEHGRAPTETEKFDVYQQHDDLYQLSASMTYGLPRGTSKQVFGVAAFFVIQLGADAEKIREFYSQIKSGAGLTRRSPSLVLRENIKDGLFKFPQDQQVYTIVHMFSQWLSKDKVPGAVEPVLSMPKVKF